MSPTRDAVGRELLEMVKEVKSSMKAAPPTAPGAEPPLRNEEIAALMASRGSPLAGLEFKQALPVIKDSDLDFERHLREGHRRLLRDDSQGRCPALRPFGGFQEDLAGREHSDENLRQRSSEGD